MRVRRPWRLVVSVFALLACLAGLLVIGLSQLAEQRPALDIYNHAMPYWLILLAFIALTSAWFVWSAGHKTVLAAPALLFAATLYLSWVFIGPEIAGFVRPQRAPAAPEALKIVSYNLNMRNSAGPVAAEWIAAQKADIVLLQEAGDRSREILDALITQYPYQIDCLSSKAHCSTLILLREPPRFSKGLAKGDPQNRKTLSAAYAESCFSGALTRIVSVHLSRPGGARKQERDMVRLAKEMEQFPPDSIIVAGDFNATPWSFALRDLDHALGVKRITHGLMTWPADDPYLPPLLPIDHVYVGDRFQVRDIRLGPANGSDHRPVIVSLALKTTAGATSDSDAECL
ncbi:endonuclease/exonuclease/phosphatase family protein [Marinicaulis aureus]|uniref:Endonuclease/exonuclease/phosphatase family protein n=1 Tax=Hyphococcus aureus TaxID=2666033 RepID=A0ABW1L0U5_9PROT